MDELHPLNRDRLVALLEEINQTLSEFIARARSDTGALDAAAAPPGCPVREHDIRAATLYLQQVGLGIDGARLRSEYDDLGLQCLRAIMLVHTWDKPTEGPALQQQLGAFVKPVANEAEFKEQQDFLRWSSMGSASALETTIQGLLKTLGQTNDAPLPPSEAAASQLTGGESVDLRDTADTESGHQKKSQKKNRHFLSHHKECINEYVSEWNKGSREGVEPFVNRWVELNSAKLRRQGVKPSKTGFLKAIQFNKSQWENRLKADTKRTPPR